MSQRFDPPSYVDGASVVSSAVDCLPSGQRTVFLIPEDPADARIWNFNLYTGEIRLVGQP